MLSHIVPEIMLKTLLVAGVLYASVAQSAIVRVDALNFTADAGTITFSEFAVGTENPVYTPENYDGGLGSPTVSFGGRFIGQSFGMDSACPAGAELSGCIMGLPSGPLTLSNELPNTIITGDDAVPTSPVLSGNPPFENAISILFDIDLVGVGLDIGSFDFLGSTAVRVFNRQGDIIGLINNEVGLGNEFFGLLTDDGLAAIAGLQILSVGAGPDGFGIDNLIFATADEVVEPNPVPLPAALPLFASALGLGAIALRRKAVV